MDLGFIDWHALPVLVIVFVTFWLFANERLPVQSTALLCLLALMPLFGLVPYSNGGQPLGPEQFLAGFGNPALVTICFLMMLGHGLVAFSMSVSSVVNDTPVVVLTIPVLVAIAARVGSSATRTLLPMNYAVIIGGMATTIGTSTNLLVMAAAGYRFIDFVRAGLPLAILMLGTLTWLLAREYALAW